MNKYSWKYYILANICRHRYTALLKWMCEAAIYRPKGKGPSGKMMFGGAVAFLWERERIGNDEAIRYCMSELVDSMYG